jgi:hypothetical protein
MKEIFLSLLFSLPTGQIITGNEVRGWSDIPMPSKEVCLERAKAMYANNYHVSQKPDWATAMVVFCKEVNK